MHVQKCSLIPLFRACLVAVDECMFTNGDARPLSLYILVCLLHFLSPPSSGDFYVFKLLSVQSFEVVCSRCIEQLVYVS